MAIPYLFSDLHFTFIPAIKYKTVNIFVENTVVETNENIYFSNEISKSNNTKIILLLNIIVN